MTKLRKFYIILIIVSVIFSLNNVFKKIKIESQYKTYETIMELKDVKSMASLIGKDYIDVAKEFEDVGINRFIIFENTIDSMKISEKYHLSTIYDGLDLIVKGDENALKYIEKGINQVSKEKREMFYNGKNELVIKGKLSDYSYNDSEIMKNYKKGVFIVGKEKLSILEHMGLGYFEDELNKLNENKVPFILRPNFLPMVQDSKKSIDRYMDYIKKYNKTQRDVIFSGKEILGGEGNINYLAEKMEENNLIPILVESATQDGNIETIGLEDLVKKMDYKTTRVFSTADYISKRYDYEIPFHHEGQEIMNTYYRAITERNIRIIYFRPFFDKNMDIVTNMDIYKKRFDELNSRLYRFYNIRPVKSYENVNIMPYFYSNNATGFFAIIGVIASALLLFDIIFENHELIQIFLNILLVILPGISYGFNKFIDKTNVIYALIATITFSSLSICYLLEVVKNLQNNKKDFSLFKIFLISNKTLIISMLISFLGAIIITSLYGNSDYMFEIKKFLGVKFSQMIPLIITLFSYVSILGVGKYFDREINLKEKLNEALHENVKVWQLLVTLALGFLVLLMLVRSGHTTNVEPSKYELLFRNVLEYITPSRPRNKAILLGYPSLIILILIAAKRKFKPFYLIFALSATIGQTDILNTFSHIRTPFIMSVYRVLGEYVFTFILSILMFILLNIVTKLVLKFRKREGNVNV